jgi:hypothetical protein
MNTNPPTIYIFQIGFNRCATQSITEALSSQGIAAIHYLWKPNLKKKTHANIALTMHQNITSGKKILHGNLSSYQAFLDMEYARGDEILTFYTYFKEMYQQYPNSIFIMNTRPIQEWIMSRIKIGKGSHAQPYYKNINENKLKKWVHHYFNHSIEVRNFFLENENRSYYFIPFCLKESTIPQLIQQIHQIIPPEKNPTPISNHLKVDFIQNIQLTPQEKQLPPSVLFLIHQLITKHGDPSQLSWWK